MVESIRVCLDGLNSTGNLYISNENKTREFSNIAVESVATENMNKAAKIMCPSVNLTGDFNGTDTCHATCSYIVSDQYANCLWF